MQQTTEHKQSKWIWESAEIKGSWAATRYTARRARCSVPPSSTGPIENVKMLYTQPNPTNMTDIDGRAPPNTKRQQLVALKKTKKLNKKNEYNLKTLELTVRYIAGHNLS